MPPARPSASASASAGKDAVSTAAAAAAAKAAADTASNLATTSRTVLIADARTGQIWRPLEWKKIMAGYTRKGTLLKLCNSSKQTEYALQPGFGSAIPRGSGTGFEKNVPFACICFSREMANPSSVEPFDAKPPGPPVFYSYVMCAADQRGHIYATDFVRNRYWLVARTGVAGTSVCFNAVRRREIIIALADRSIHCYNIDNCQLVAKLPVFHQSAAHHIAVHPTRPLAISTSNTEAILWDTESWERRRILVGSASGVQQVIFSKDGLSIVAAFEDGSIFFWMIDSFSLQWRITLDQMTGAVSGAEMNTTQLLTSPRFSYFALSYNGELFAFSGLSSTVYVWNMVEKRLLHEILIPAFHSTLIVQIEFVGPTNLLALLSSTGVLIFIDAAEAKFAGQLQGRHRFHSFATSPDGLVLASILLDAKHAVSLVRLDAILYPEETHGVLNEDQQLESRSRSQAPKPETKRAIVTMEQPKTFYDLVESKEETSVLNKRKLARFLAHYGEYPAQYRPLIWRFLLKLPESRAGYEALLDQGVHPSFKDFRKRFPLKSDRKAKSMEKILSCLAFWSPIFENLDYLPAMVFPFASLFANDLFSGLETIMTVIINWCQKWWEYYPNPPIDCLDMLEDMLGYHDPELLAHFVQEKVTSQIYAWSMMQSFFSDLFSRSDWLKLWDHLLSQPPSFMYHFILAYILSFRASLLDTRGVADFKFFFQRRNAANVTRILHKAYDLQSMTPDSVSPATFLAPFTPCIRGEYPVFNKYPEFIVNYQTHMREKIRADETEYLRKRRMADEVSRLTEELRKDKRAWESADWKMDQMVEKWWDQMMGKLCGVCPIACPSTAYPLPRRLIRHQRMLGQEEARLATQSHLDTAEKEQRAAAMQQIADARRAFIDQQVSSTEQHISSISRAVGRNRRERDQAADHEQIDKAFKEVENEWLRRRDEMVKTRGELASIQQARIRRLVEHAEDTS
ncbi:hypothetical protein BC831DRAFT_432109 [Entophlyctis helioformis]|nr:hypothetical protein BC831DRAFT_432109 [Entophlyctis helioformis]